MNPQISAVNVAVEKHISFLVLVSEGASPPGSDGVRSRRSPV